MSASVSVVIPAYNAERYLAAAVRSVLSQTRVPDQIIVVDDGSTDGTAKVAGDVRGGIIEYIHQANRGVSAARNTGIAASDSEFVAFLDADDEWLPRKLETQLERFAARPDIMASFAECWVVDVRTGVRTTTNFWTAPEMVEALLLHSCIVGNASSVVIPRAVIQHVGGFNETLSHTADWDLWLRLCELGPVDLVTDPVVVYRQHASNMSRNIRLLEGDTFRTLEAFYAAEQRSERYRRIRKRAYSNHFMILSGSYLHARQPLHAIRCLIRGVALYPPNLTRALGMPSRAAGRALARIRTRTR